MARSCRCAGAGSWRMLLSAMKRKNSAGSGRKRWGSAAERQGDNVAMECIVGRQDGGAAAGDELRTDRRADPPRCPRAAHPTPPLHFIAFCHLPTAPIAAAHPAVTKSASCFRSVFDVFCTADLQAPPHGFLKRHWRLASLLDHTPMQSLKK